MMPSAKEEISEVSCLLPDKSTAISMGRNHDESISRENDLLCSSNDEDDDEDSDVNNCHLKTAYSNSEKIVLSKSHMNLQRRHQIHRGARRIVRLIICIILMPVILTMLYLPFYSTVYTRQAELLDWGRNISRNIGEYIFPDNDTTLLKPASTCKTRDKFFLLIAVCSGLQNFAARQTIRETWGNTSEFNYGMFLQLHAHLKGKYLYPSKQRLKHYKEYLGLNENKTISNSTIIPLRIVFFVGRNKPMSSFDDATMTAIRIRNESERYQDIVQDDFIDTYNNLTLKSMLALKWVTRHCLENCAYLMKCDDDTFVNIPNLLQYLLGGTIPLYNDTLDLYTDRTYNVLSSSNRLNKTRNYLAGHLFCNVRPLADFNNKWYMPYYMYPNDVYPKYLSGGGYIMSIDVVPKLFEAAFNTTLIYLEDIYVTGLCAEKINIQRTHEPLFSYIRKKNLCSLKGSITQHQMKGDRLLEAYTFVTNLTNQCAQPSSLFKYLPLRRQGNCG